MVERRQGLRIAAASLLLLAAGPAAAECIANGVRFEFADNKTFHSRMTVTGKGCVRSFTGGLSVTYESITVTQRPRHMRVEPTSNGFGYTLTVLGGYKGPDRFALRTCGVGRTGRGCATIVYDVTIQ